MFKRISLLMEQTIFMRTKYVIQRETKELEQLFDNDKESANEEVQRHKAGIKRQPIFCNRYCRAL
ncbi:hypothetical protein FH972_019493 [Carpinus fangiana]|uniref:Uncharacterized protein n=1 Tax=Carpinus fangiana TaxID=176857 RepID=A0A5N6RRU0_9ROSI|nr:hypothetical protein FH972_019493 [Carpinus fangiana]